MDLLHHLTFTFGKDITLPKDGHDSKVCMLLLELFSYFQETRIATVPRGLFFFSVKTISIFGK